jgi:hypothetical protein
LARVSGSLASLPSASNRSRSASSHSPCFMRDTAKPLYRGACTDTKSGDVKQYFHNTVRAICKGMYAKDGMANTLWAEEQSITNEHIHSKPIEVLPSACFSTLCHCSCTIGTLAITYC